MSYAFDLAIIGGGPGGYVAAIYAAQSGKKVVLVEKDQLGGVCLNWGCIPSKHYIQQAENIVSAKSLSSVGISTDYSKFDLGLVQQSSRKVVKTLTGGIAGLLKKNKVTVINAFASFSGPNQLSLSNGETLQAENIIVATGSSPLKVKGFEPDGVSVLDSTDILSLCELPASLVILGGGAIGCEFAYVMNSFGVDVTIIEAQSHLLPSEDQQLTSHLRAHFEGLGIKVMTDTRAHSIGRDGALATVNIDNAARGSESLTAEKILVVFGRSPNTTGIGLDKVGITPDQRGFIETDAFGVAGKGIYAIGDVTRSPLLAHVASREGELAVQHMFGMLPEHHEGIDESLIPSAIYCDPQIAGFGLREQDIDNYQGDVAMSVFNLSGAGKSIAIGKPEGMVKILADAKTHEILGAHILGHNATELIHEILLAKSSELLVDDIAHMMHAHPTLSEAVLEAAKGVFGKPIHA